MSPFDSPLAPRQPLVFASGSRIPFPLFSHHSQAGELPHLLKSGSARDLTEKQSPKKCRPFVLDVPSQWVPSVKAFLASWALELGYSAGLWLLVCGWVVCLYHFFLLLLSAPFIPATKTATFLKSDALKESCVRKYQEPFSFRGWEKSKGNGQVGKAATKQLWLTRKLTEVNERNERIQDVLDSFEGAINGLQVSIFNFCLLFSVLLLWLTNPFSKCQTSGIPKSFSWKDEDLLKKCFPFLFDKVNGDEHF